MLADNQSRRPTISAVSQTLEFFSLFPLQDSYYGICCRPESYNERVEALERKSERQNAFLEGRIFAMQQKLGEQDEQRNQTALLKREHEREVGRLEGRIFAVQEEQQNMKKAHESKQSGLLKNHELQIDQLKGDHDRERHQLRVMVDDMRQEQQKIQEIHKSEETALVESYEMKISRLINGHSDEIFLLKYEKSDQLNKHAKQIAKLKNEYQSRTDQLKENIFVMQEKHQSEKKALSNKYENQISNLRKQVAFLRDAHGREIKEFQQQQEQDKENFRKELLSRERGIVDEKIERLQKEMEWSVERSEEEMVALQYEHKSQINAIINKYDAMMRKPVKELVLKDDDINTSKVLHKEKMARITGVDSTVKEDFRKDVANTGDIPVNQTSKEEKAHEITANTDVVEAAAPSDQNRTQAQNMAMIEQNLPENAKMITTRQRMWGQSRKDLQEKTNDSPPSSSGVSKETKDPKDPNTRENRQLTRVSSPKGSKPGRKSFFEKAAKKFQNPVKERELGDPLGLQRI
jgi:hypothetical protein